eukprot:scaffold1531_cov59-Phaeocystis_antarctica.AAC.8
MFLAFSKLGQRDARRRRRRASVPQRSRGMMRPSSCTRWRSPTSTASGRREYGKAVSLKLEVHEERLLERLLEGARRILTTGVK